MHDDELMDRLLRDVMAADAPQLSPGFDTRVMRRVRPRRLAPLRRKPTPRPTMRNARRDTGKPIT